MSKQVDWSQVRADYEAGLMSLRQLAQTYDISKTTLIERRNKENWSRPVINSIRPDKTQSEQKVPNRDVNAGMRAAMAVKLRTKKLTYDEIAKQCGYTSESSARKAVKREMQRIVVENVEELRQEECLILDTLHATLWPLAVPDKLDDPPNLWAVDRLLKIIEARRELMGLDKPTDEAVGPQLIIREVPAGFLPSPTVEAGQ